ncbi:hypothetical protein GCM10028857_00280 [Salinarchaeum chitinilyticum]
MKETTESTPPPFEQLAEEIEEREQQRSRRDRMERRARWRNKYRLLRKWQSALEEYRGPGDAHLVTGYRPSGFVAPIDAPEIAGLAIWDATGTAHHFRLYRDETVAFIESPNDPRAPPLVDPMRHPRSDPAEHPGGRRPRSSSDSMLWISNPLGWTSATTTTISRP